MLKQNYNIGEIYWINLNGVGCVQDGWHPGIIVQNNMGNLYSQTISIVPITSKRKAKLPTHVFIRAQTYGLRLDSIVQCEGQQTVCKSQIAGYIGTADSTLMKKIAKACLINTPYLNYLNDDEVGVLKQKK